VTGLTADHLPPNSQRCSQHHHQRNEQRDAGSTRVLELDGKLTTATGGAVTPVSSHNTKACAAGLVQTTDRS
jgi:hypothetical protein